MKKTVLIFSSLLIMVIVISCSKGGSPTDDGGGGVHIPTPSDTTAPVIDIYTPSSLQVFANGSVINVTGKVSDDYGLYRGSVRIYNDANGFLMKEQLYEIHGIKSYNVSVNHPVAATTASDYTVTVSYEDHGYNVTTKSVKIKVTP